jgi:glycosyltransferase involved in cell wall biosynthesis
MNALVTVITPTKNRFKLLCEAIDSIQRQSFHAWEHIIVDDGSDDATPDEVRTRAAADPRIRYLQRNSRISGANVCRNIGIAESRAALIIFLDSDDLLRPQCLERRVEIMQQNPVLDFAVFRAGVFVKSVGDLKRLYHSQNPGDDLLRFLTLECPWGSPGPIWRRAFLDRIGRFDETLLSMQDLEMHVRALAARAKYICLPYTDHDIRGQEDDAKTSMRHFKDPVYIEAAEKVHEKFLDILIKRGLLTWSVQRALLGLTFGTAENWVRSRRLVYAMRVWKRGCARHRARLPLQIAGLFMISVLRLSTTQEGVCGRLVNKWKGWVRFRQEPALLQRRDESLPENFE